MIWFLGKNPKLTANSSLKGKSKKGKLRLESFAKRGRFDQAQTLQGQGANGPSAGGASRTRTNDILNTTEVTLTGVELSDLTLFINEFFRDGREKFAFSEVKITFHQRLTRKFTTPPLTSVLSNSGINQHPVP